MDYRKAKFGYFILAINDCRLVESAIYNKTN